MASRIKNVVVSALTVAFLTGAAIDRAKSMVAPEDTATYQAHIRDVYAQLPMRIGDWVGQDTEVPQSAIAILHPNVIMSRRYRNFMTGRVADVLLVQCSDVRDMSGHYPPICYPNQGWVQERTERGTWRAGSLEIPGTEYQFMRFFEQGQVRRVVRDFMILPDGTMAPDMDAIRRSTSVRRRYYGAGQMQVIVDAGVPGEERDEIFGSLVEGHESIIRAIMQGTVHPVAPLPPAE